MLDPYNLHNDYIHTFTITAVSLVEVQKLPTYIMQMLVGLLIEQNVFVTQKLWHILKSNVIILLTKMTLYVSISVMMYPRKPIHSRQFILCTYEMRMYRQ